MNKKQEDQKQFSLEKRLEKRINSSNPVDGLCYKDG